MLQLPNHKECKQNCAKRDSRRAPLMDRELLCSSLAKSGSCTPTGSMQTFKTVSIISYKKNNDKCFLTSKSSMFPNVDQHTVKYINFLKKLETADVQMFMKQR